MFIVLLSSFHFDFCYFSWKKVVTVVGEGFRRELLGKNTDFDEKRGDMNTKYQKLHIMKHMEQANHRLYDN